MNDRGQAIIDMSHNPVAPQVESQIARMMRVLSRAGGRIDRADIWFDLANVQAEHREREQATSNSGDT